MRLHRVVVCAALTAVLASVAVPGSVGSRTPSGALEIDRNAFRPIQLGAGSMMTPLLNDRTEELAGMLYPNTVLIEPDTVLPGGPRPGAAVPAAPVITTGKWHFDQELSWYGPGFYGQHTACGQTLTTTLVGVANRTLPCGTLITFRNPVNGKIVTAPVVDRGPYVSGRQWDLTYAACAAIGHCWTGSMYWRYG